MRRTPWLCVYVRRWALRILNRPRAERRGDGGRGANLEALPRRHSGGAVAGRGRESRREALSVQGLPAGFRLLDSKLEETHRQGEKFPGYER